MKAKLTFDLDDRDDKMAHLRCVKSLDMACAIFEVVNNNKHLTDKQIVEKMYDEFKPIDIDNLIE
tara:strand:+ start:1012 stop:1206 length:195 start_codon:yes stop_codon:yes gene_type:complete